MRSIFSEKEFIFSRVLKVLIFFIFFSIIPAQIFWNQNLIDTFISTLPFLTFLFYFFLIRTKPTIADIEYVIWFFVIIYLVCFYAALIIAPVKIFEGFGELDKGIDTTRGLSRIRLTIIGGGPLYLAYFFSISKIKKSKKVKWVFICLFLFISILLHLGRQAIFFSFILGLLYFIERLSLMRKFFILLFASIAAWFIINYESIVSNLLEITKADYSNQLEGDDNIRLKAYNFYLFEVSPNIYTILFGNGQYSLGKSAFGNFIDKNGRSNGYIPADVGYGYIHLNFGIIGLCLFLIVLFSALSAKIQPESNYSKYYLGFLFLGSFAGNTLLGNIPLFCICLYIILISMLKKNKIQSMNVDNLIKS
jgi:hypothetical protein